VSPAPLGDLDGTETVILSDETHEGHPLTEVRPYFDRGVLRAGIVTHERGEPAQTRAGVINLSDGTVRQVRLFGPRQGNFKQGWSPLISDGVARFVAWWEPTEVFELDEETGEFARVALRMAPHIAERFQGGSQGILVPGGYLFLVNESVNFDPENEVVLTRFVRVDAGFQITDVSPQFFVKDRGKDVACGLARRGDRLIAGFTSAGSEPLLATMDVGAVLATLIPMVAPGPRSAAAHLKQ
jgi:hypothetical protein